MIKMLKELSDKEFVREMQILYHKLYSEARETFEGIIRDYYNKGKRAEKIINKLKEQKQFEDMDLL